MDLLALALATIGAVSGLVQTVDIIWRRMGSRFKKNKSYASANSRDVSVALTGVSATCSVGNMKPGIEVALR